MKFRIKNRSHKTELQAQVQNSPTPLIIYELLKLGQLTNNSLILFVKLDQSGWISWPEVPAIVVRWWINKLWWETFVGGEIDQVGIKEQLTY